VQTVTYKHHTTHRAITSAGFAGGFTSTVLNGGSLGAALRNGAIGGVMGAVTAGFANAIGTYGQTISNSATRLATRAVLHGALSSFMSAARGGKWSAGFWSGAVGTTLGSVNTGNDYFGNVAKNAIISGTVSEITGGKFSNGAALGAFRYMFNDAVHEGTSLIKDWLMGTGDKVQVFGPDSQLTKELKTDPAVDWAKKDFIDNYLSLKVQKKYYAIKFGVTDFLFGNTSTLQNIGSYGLSLYAYPQTNELIIVISNDMGFNSLTAGLFSNIESGMMSTKETWFWWKESIIK